MSNAAIEKRQNQVNVPERISQGTCYTPLVDIYETGDAFIFEADVPGVKGGDIDISFENGVLTLDAKVNPRQGPDQSYIWQEYGVGHFHRQFSLNTPVDVNAIKAELKNGELRVTVPKAESARTRKIQIKSD
jgi:HSP20 family molecular chaperone IbpA